MTAQGKESDVTSDPAPQHDHQNNKFGLAEAITISTIWLCGLLACVLIATNYGKGEKISLENAIGYIVIGLVVVSVGVLFRDAISDWIRNWHDTY